MSISPLPISNSSVSISNAITFGVNVFCFSNFSILLGFIIKSTSKLSETPPKSSFVRFSPEIFIHVRGVIFF
jgi:hypothetical protein